MLRLIFLFLFTLFCCSSPPSFIQKKINIQKFLSSLTREELFFLEYFFRCLIQEDAIGYSLINAKPMSFFSYLQPKRIDLKSYEITPDANIELFIEGFTPKWALFHKGFEIWNNYKHLFCGNNIYFDVHGIEGDLLYKRAIVLNKCLLLPLFEKHLPIFQNLDSSLNDAESVFKALLEDKKFKQKFYSSPAIVGICLGYGEKNALLFDRMVNIMSSLGAYGFTLEMQRSPEKRKILKDEFAALQTSSHALKSHKTKKFLFSSGVSYRADFTNPETHLLQDKYLNAAKTLTCIYENENSFLEKTINLIISADDLIPGKNPPKSKENGN